MKLMEIEPKDNTMTQNKITMVNSNMMRMANSVKKLTFKKEKCTSMTMKWQKTCLQIEEWAMKIMRMAWTANMINMLKNKDKRKKRIPSKNK